jgi:hypothetical protein
VIKNQQGVYLRSVANTASERDGMHFLRSVTEKIKTRGANKGLVSRFL